VLQFFRLRLSGFKSFVDATDLPIEPGLTGIVGPNGCGKSNLIEALRWVMGEGSARSLRGGEMDDVIFAGSADRPPRQLAEVMIEIANGTGVAPPPFQGDAELQVSRRIERTRGSAYRINGRDARARDVQMLFVDGASGAHSSAMVTQGQVSALIVARPADRRTLLEEAAGISGMHARRQEAESRLVGAEANLRRLDDVLATLAVQAENIRRQAVQADRYRILSVRIRKLEAGLLLRRWEAALAAADTATAHLASAEARIVDLTAENARAGTAQMEAVAALPERRAEAAAAVTTLERLVRDLEGLEEEAGRTAALRDACWQRLEQVRADLVRQRAFVDDGDQALGRLGQELDRLQVSRMWEADGEAVARNALAHVKDRLVIAERDAVLATEKVAAIEAQLSAVKRQMQDLDARRQRLEVRSAELDRQRGALEAEAARLSQSEPLDPRHTEKDLEAAQVTATAAETKRARLAAEAAAARAALTTADAAWSRCESERQALLRILQHQASEPADSLAGALVIEPGFDSAVAAALGEALTASLREEGAVHWRELPPLADLPPLPADVSALAQVVSAPPHLARRLSQTGLVADADQGWALQSALTPGQVLVSRHGGAWRWDGFVSRPDRPTPSAVELEHRRRLADLSKDAERTTATRATAKAAADDLSEQETQATAEERAAQAALRAAEARHHGTLVARTEADARRLGNVSKTTAIDEARGSVAAELDAILTEQRSTAEAYATLPPIETARRALEEVRTDLERVRAEEREQRSVLERMVREAESRRRRIGQIESEVTAWQERRTSAASQLAALEDRERATEAEFNELDAKPADLAVRRHRLADAHATAERDCRRAGDALAIAEEARTLADRRLRRAETDLFQAREERVRAEASLREAESVRQSLVSRIADRLDIPPDGLPQLAAMTDADGPPETAQGDLETLERRLDRLKRERDQMGPVNLRAVDELATIERQIGDLGRQKDDLIEAVAKLRHGVAELDREARDRLLRSFTEIDQHFRALFIRLFGGGEAHLKLTDPDEPLGTGLDILASPPGKRLQHLSLLSGGEQALAALALRFALMRTQPVPICVLDEVDAALDDANVDRFCSLLEDMAAAGTRFLVITHHRLTMARMHRLFGVTMVERGVSQLVSVDLQSAEAFGHG
jgi:chromosome segregation protein